MPTVEDILGPPPDSDTQTVTDILGPPPSELTQAILAASPRNRPLVNAQPGPPKTPAGVKPHLWTPEEIAQRNPQHVAPEMMEGAGTRLLRAIPADVAAGIGMALNPKDSAFYASAAGNIPAAITGPKINEVTGEGMSPATSRLPIDEIVQQEAKEAPAATTVAKISQGISETAPMAAIGGLPAWAGKLALAGFTVDMIKNLPATARALGEEMGKAADDRDYGKITDLVSGAVQQLLFGALGVKSLGSEALASKEAISRALVDKYVPRGQGVAPAKPGYTGLALTLPAGAKPPKSDVSGGSVVSPEPPKGGTPNTESEVQNASKERETTGSHGDSGAPPGPTVQPQQGAVENVPPAAPRVRVNEGAEETQKTEPEPQPPGPRVSQPAPGGGGPGQTGNEVKQATPPPAATPLESLGAKEGFAFDGPVEFPGVSGKLLSFTFKNVPKDDPAYGATFYANVSDTAAQIIEKGRAKAAAMREAAPPPPANPAPPEVEATKSAAPSVEPTRKPVVQSNALPPQRLPQSGINSKDVAAQYGMPADFYGSGDETGQISSKYRTAEYDAAVESEKKANALQGINATAARRQARQKVEDEFKKIVAAARQSSESPKPQPETTTVPASGENAVPGPKGLKITRVTDQLRQYLKGNPAMGKLGPDEKREWLREFGTPSHDTGRKLRYTYHLSDGRIVSADGALKFTNPKAYEAIKARHANLNSDKARVEIFKAMPDDVQKQIIDEIPIDEIIKQRGFSADPYGAAARYLTKEGHLLGGSALAKAGYGGLVYGESMDLDAAEKSKFATAEDAADAWRKVNKSLEPLSVLTKDGKYVATIKDSAKDRLLRKYGWADAVTSAETAKAAASPAAVSEKQVEDRQIAEEVQKQKTGQSPLSVAERVELNELRISKEQRGKLGVLNEARLEHLESREKQNAVSGTETVPKPAAETAALPVKEALPVTTVTLPVSSKVDTSQPEFVGMGAAVPSEFERSPGTPTSIKNATVDAERAARGLPAAMEPARRSFGAVWDEAMAAIDHDPGITDRLIDSLREKPRALTDFEDALLLHKQIELQNDYGKLTRELANEYEASKEYPNRLDFVAELKGRVAGLSDMLLDLYDIGKKVGSETGRGLNARKMMANEDYTLAQMEVSKRAANGGAPLTEEQSKEVRDLHDQVTRTQKAYDDYVAATQEKISKLEAQRALDEIYKTQNPPVEPHVRTLANKIIGSLESAADAAMKRIQTRRAQGRTMASVTLMDPADLADHAIYGAAKIAKGITEFSAWSAGMLSDFGDYIKPHLKQIFDASGNEFDRSLSEAGVKPTEKAKVTRVAKTQPVEKRIENVKGNIEKKFKAGKLDEITTQVQQLARFLVESGVKDREKLIDQVHEFLKTVDPTITRLQAMDAISGRGKFWVPNQDEVSKTVRDLKEQIRLVGHQIDVTAKRPLPRTGYQRGQMSDTARQELAKLNELKRKYGVTVTDPKAQLASVLAARKTYYKNRISDLAQEIATREKIVKSKTPSPTDTELDALKAEYTKLKAEHDEIFTKPGLTDEQRAALVEKSLDRQIAEVERQLKTGEIFPGSKPAKLSTPAIEAKRARLEALKDEREWARDTIQPKPERDPEAIALKALKTRLSKRTADLYDRLANGDFASRPKRPPVPLDAEGVRLKAANERAKLAFQKGLQEDRLKRRSTLEKIQDTFVKWRRGFLLSSPITLAKLTAAAMQRMTITPIEEAVGGVLGKVPGLSKVAARAPREGGFNAQAEARALTDAVMKGMKDSWDILRTGQSELDVLYGQGREGYVRESFALPHSLIDFFGQVHGALKAPAKRAEFARAFEKRATLAIANGVDVTDPMVQTRLAVESYKDANRSIFLQDNRVVSAYKRALTAFEEPNKATGKAPLSTKVLGTVARIALPIVRVPTNLIAETFQYAFGTVTGSARLAAAMARGIDGLKPEEADLIMRELKKGSIGAAVMLLGYFNPQAVGGYYQQFQKRKADDVKYGSIRIYGYNVPSFLLHNPLLETAQIGATVRRVADSKLHKHDATKQGIGAGILAGGLGLTEEVPFVNDTLELTKAFNPQERNQFFGEYAKSLLVPQLVQFMATEFDKDAQGNPVNRNPKTIFQNVETGVPGLRKNVPAKGAGVAVFPPEWFNRPLARTTGTNILTQ